MYERTNPYYEYVAGGSLDMSECRYEQFGEKTCRITNTKFIPSEGRIKVKLEGSGFVGKRYMGLAGIRDPYTIKNIDKVIELSLIHILNGSGGKHAGIAGTSANDYISAHFKRLDEGMHAGHGDDAGGSIQFFQGQVAAAVQS